MSGSLSSNDEKQAAGQAPGCEDSLPLAGRVLRLPHLVLAFVALLLFFTVLFGKWTATSPWGFPRFVVAVVLLAYVPGRTLLDIGRLQLRWLESLALSMLLGLTSGALLFWVTGFLRVPGLFLLWPLAALAVYCFRRRTSWRALLRLRVRPRGAHWLLVGVMAANLVPLAFLPFYYPNLAKLPHGRMTITPLVEVFMHLSIGNEVTHSIPPQVPFLSGIPLSYHYGMNLVTAMFSCAAGLSVPDLTVRFLPTFFVALTTLLLFCLARAWPLPEYAAAFVSFLVMLGEDFSFIPGLLLRPTESWSVVFFQAPSTYSLYCINPMLAALAVLSGGLFFLVKFCQDGGRARLVWASFLLAILVEFKVFTAAQTLVALGIAGLVCLVFFRDVRLLKVAGLAGTLMSPLLLYVWIGNTGGAGEIVKVGFSPQPFVSESFSAMGLGDTGIGRVLKAVFSEGLGSAAQAVALLLVALPIYLVGGLGLRAIAFPTMLKALFRPSRLSPQRLFLAVFVLGGIAITFLCEITVTNIHYNNVVWFFVVSKLVAWVFVVEVIWGFIRGKPRLVQVAVVALAALLSLPSTVQNFSTQAAACKMETLEGNDLALVRFLQRSCKPGEVIFSDGGTDLLIAAMTKGRTPIADTPVVYSFASPREVGRRWTDVRAFWDPQAGDQLRCDILHRYNAVYLVVDKRKSPMRVSERYAFTSPLFENAHFAVYQVRR